MVFFVFQQRKWSQIAGCGVLRFLEFFSKFVGVYGRVRCCFELCCFSIVFFIRLEGLVVRFICEMFRSFYFVIWMVYGGCYIYLEFGFQRRDLVKDYSFRVRDGVKIRIQYRLVYITVQFRGFYEQGVYRMSLSVVLFVFVLVVFVYYLEVMFVGYCFTWRFFCQE